MEKFVFTFYQRHPLKRFCQPVFAPNRELARQKMIEKYGDDWDFQYTEEEWNEWTKKARDWGLESELETELAPISWCKEQVS